MTNVNSNNKFKYRILEANEHGYIILMEDGGVATVDLNTDENYVYAEMYQSRLDLNDHEQGNIFETLGEGKMYRSDYKHTSDLNDKTVLAETLAWLAVGATFEHDPELHDDFVKKMFVQD